MTYQEAIAALKTGKVVARAEWSDKTQKLGMQKPDENLYLVSGVEGKHIAWTAPQADTDATDWHIVE